MESPPFVLEDAIQRPVGLKATYPPPALFRSMRDTSPRFRRSRIEIDPSDIGIARSVPRLEVANEERYESSETRTRISLPVFAS